MSSGTTLAAPPARLRRTFVLLRLENLALLAVCVALALLHAREVRWLRFIALFAAIDLVGFVPGAIARKLRGERPISKAFHALYDATHSFVPNALVAAAWCLVAGPEWALLAIPIHLCGDRALFGNFPAFEVFAPPALPPPPVAPALRTPEPAHATAR